MHASTLEPLGLFGNAITGWRLAWCHRRQLLPALLPVLVPLLVALFVLDLTTTGADTSIINGAFVFGSSGGAMPWVKLGLALACWLLAVTAGTVVMVGALRATTISSGRALALAIRQLPALGGYLLTVATLAIGASWAGLALANALGGPPGLIVLVATMAGVALVAARMLLGVVAMTLGSAAWDLSRGRVLGTAGAFLLGGIAVPLLLFYLRDSVRAAVAWPAVVDVLDAVLLVVVVAAQSGILGYTYLQRRETAAIDQYQAADLDAVDARLRPLSGRPWRWTVIGLAVLVPMLLPAGLAAANPYDSATMRSHRDGPPGGAMAVGWPAGQHPIIVSDIGVRFCDDDPCTSHVVHSGGPPVIDGYSTVGIGADGTVIKAAVMGSEDTGGPFIHYARCTRDSGCREAWLPTRASAREPFAWPQLAVSNAPDGAILFALATPTLQDQPTRATVDLKLIRCVDLTCAKPQRNSLGTLAATMDQGHSNQPRSRLAVDSDGRPLASFWIGHAVHIATCEPVTCANPRVATHTGGPHDAPWTTLGGIDDGVLSLNLGGLHTADRATQLVQTGFDESSAALAVTGTGTYATLAVAAADLSGLRVTIGQQPEYWRYILWHCPDRDCLTPRRIPLDVDQGPPQPIRLAVSDDGQVLVVRQSRVTLVPPLK